MELEQFNQISYFLSEFIATFLLIYLGCMGCIMGPMFPNNHFQMCFNFGLVIMMMLVVFHCVTGPHMNPALSLTAVLYKRITWKRALLYFVAQMLGGICGYGFLILCVPDETINIPGADHGMCVTRVNSEINLGQAVAIEFMVTWVLCLVCCGIWDPRNAKHIDGIPVKFGFTIASLALTGGSFTGASMNPARSFGPALWHLDFEEQWVYWVGPLAGGIAAPLLYNAVFWRNENGTKEYTPKEDA